MFLIYGGSTGWIGGLLMNLLKEEAVAGQARIENREAVELEIEKLKPDFIINCAGKTGRPNVDWCENNQQETIRSNVLGALTLADVAFKHHIHVTYFGTGCIYEFDEKHTPEGNGFKEEDVPNFSGSFYSRSKIMTESLLKSYPNVLTLRLRMPISDDLHPRSFVTKITQYEKVVNVPNSMTMLSELLPIAIDMTKKKLTGIYNFTNPGVITHNEVLSLYKNYIKQDFEWKNFTVEEQSKILKAGRSNNKLDVNKLLSLYPNIQEIYIAMDNCFKRMSQSINQSHL